ncbi:MAG TPA: hypothetical protein VNA18_06025 [Nitrososphaeraceae archaeon]|nr:hypothetical protein [Nitrososphaeraceae archaeon]
MLSPVVSISFILVSNTQIFGAELGDGHNMPMVNLGGRTAMLDFSSTQLPATNNVQLDFTLIDNKLVITYNIQLIL